MSLDLLAVENLIQKENNFKFLNPKINLNYKSTINSKKVVRFHPFSSLEKLKTKFHFYLELSKIKRKLFTETSRM